MKYSLPVSDMPWDGSKLYSVSTLVELGDRKHFDDEGTQCPIVMVIHPGKGSYHAPWENKDHGVRYAL